MSELGSSAPSRRRTITTWVLTILVAAVFVMAGFQKITQAEAMVTAFNGFGLPLWFMTLVGIAEIVGAIGLLLPPIAFVAGLGLMGLAAAPLSPTWRVAIQSAWPSPRSSFSSCR